MKFDLLGKNKKDITFHTEVEGGTYIRKLIHDLGQALGINANMTKLRRIRVGIFKEKDSIKLEALEKINGKELEKVIIPAEEAITKVYPVVQIKEDNLKQIFTGKPIHKGDLVKQEKFEKEKIVCVFSGEKFIGMYKVVNDEEVFAKGEFVMQEIKQ
jgi:H/ACA ribonucleoprotein complex subunit 4